MTVRKDEEKDVYNNNDETCGGERGFVYMALCCLYY